MQSWSKNGQTLTVPPEFQHYVENPAIASIPQKSADYCKDCANITKKDLKHILNPQSLSPLEEELMSYHIKLHHLQFPRKITQETSSLEE